MEIIPLDNRGELDFNQIKYGMRVSLADRVGTVNIFGDNWFRVTWDHGLMWSEYHRREFKH